MYGGQAEVEVFRFLVTIGGTEGGPQFYRRARSIFLSPVLAKRIAQRKREQPKCSPLWKNTLQLVNGYFERAGLDYVEREYG
jgi:hypothetical protein